MARYFSEYPEYTEISLEEKLLRDKLIAVMERYTQEMENYSYYGSNLGVPKYDYDEIADDILKEFFVKEKKVPIDFVPQDGWICESEDYGKWFISRKAVIEDWTKDQLNAYGSAPDEIDEQNIDTWFDEQIGWSEIARYGVQLNEPIVDYMTAMKRDTDCVGNFEKV